MNWTEAENYLESVIGQYTTLIGMPRVMPFFALIYFDSLLKRYNNGERTQELYDEMMSCE